MSDLLKCPHCKENIELNPTNDEYAYLSLESVYDIKCPHCGKTVHFETSVIYC
jgi:endogenous inhibitor of DNA gyrase (YacG/DUF329 family)